MKEKMERFARGEFEEVLPKLELPEEWITWKMQPDSSFTGYLMFGSQNGVRIRGYAICSDGNLKIHTPQFFGKNIKLEFTYNSRNTADGDKKRGKLILITNAGEFMVPFEVQICENVMEEGEILHEK